METLAVLAHFPKLTRKRYLELANSLTPLELVWQASEKELQSVGWDREFCKEFFSWKSALDITLLEKALGAAGIRVVTIEDADYPALLKTIYDPPVALFTRGILKTNELALALVGTRRNSAYGKQVTQELVRGLVPRGLTIVSGLALGIDGFAHEAALTAGGRTIAVLGSGIDRPSVFPSTHTGLADRIVAGGGAVISEYPPGTRSSVFSFPRRNRIIAGLSLATVVIEGSATSGALITAQCALDNGREVFAVPQNITSSTAIGPHILIQQGAHLVTNADDIAHLLNLAERQTHQTAQAIIPESPTEAAVLALLSREPIHVDVIIKQSALPSHVIASTLTLMEMKGFARNLGSMMYVRG